MFKLHHSGPFLKADNFKKARHALLAMLVIASTTTSSLAQTATPTASQTTATAGALSPAQAYFEPSYRQLRQEFNADNAYNTVAFVEKYWRIAGNTGFNASIHHVEKILQDAGYQKEVNGESDGPLTYRIETKKMKRPTWEPVDARVSIVGEATPLLEFASNRNMLAVNSASTSNTGLEAEVVYAGKGSAAELDAKEVQGKIVFVENAAAAVFGNAVKRGAIGVISYAMPAYTQPQKYTNSIQFQTLPYLDAKRQIWAVVLSYQAKEKLKQALAKSSVKLAVKVETKLYESEELTLIANVRGRSLADQRFVFSAHVQEPGANDNATGVGTLAEMARVTAQLIQRKAIAPERTITFMWGDEINSTARYIAENPKRAAGIQWGLSLDMVGEDVSKTGGSFLIEKMPDPSAIWTRGNEKHTEWGGSVLKESDMMPNYFTDFLLGRCRQQALESGWQVNANPYEGGSDHTPFLNAKIPGLLMWHFTDAFYHTDLDRLDKVSKPEMRNVGISALAAALSLSTADEATVAHIIDELLVNATDRLQTEFALSEKAVKGGADAAKEKHILEVWTNWYVAAFDKIRALPSAGMTPALNQKLLAAQKMLSDTSRKIQARL